MNAISRKDFLKAGAALPLALQSLDLRAAAKPKPATPPKRIIFICSCLGFYEPYFFPKKRGDLKTADFVLAAARRPSDCRARGRAAPALRKSFLLMAFILTGFPLNRPRSS